jgi:hypothetical protein
VLIQPRRALAEVHIGGSADTEHAASELGDVQVHLEDALLRPQRLDEHGEVGLQAFSEPTLPRPQEEVLRDLLRDRARATHALAAPAIFQRVVDRLQIEAVMRGEVLIFRCNHCNLDVRRDACVVDPAMADGRRHALTDHESRRRRIEPAERNHCADAQHDPGCERPADEAQRTPKHVGQASA